MKLVDVTHFDLVLFLRLSFRLVPEIINAIDMIFLVRKELRVIYSGLFSGVCKVYPV
ncbi:hypothetical protein O4H49_16265 [Kiloniella laminariae]|uniref:Uncharacterized protein n=1 Tax=Kiloniella laminariae TaxID=454162 RepID=A0ABT4LQX4_9PROT|nr:hypothetical protein [Kiloniella laminariae]MCZ4282342.1 hypothetical protein [Kiloniella laminariae]